MRFDFLPLGGESAFTPAINIGAAFADFYIPADYTPVLAELKNLVAAIEIRVGRHVTSGECKACEGMLKRQYQQQHPLHGHDVATAIFDTGFVGCDGKPVRLLVTMKRRSSIKLPASKKITELALVDEQGRVEEKALATLPFFIENYDDLGFALRASFPNPAWRILLMPYLVSKWTEVGAPQELPCDIPLMVDHQGVELAVRLHAHGDAARASVLVDGEEMELPLLLPEIFREISLDALGRNSMLDLADMIGASCWGMPWTELQYDLRQVFEFMARWQHVRPGIVRTFLAGEPVMVFHTGKWTDYDGEAVFGLCRDKDANGRFTSVTWVPESCLRGILRTLPAAPEWWQGGPRGFDTSLTVGHVGAHMLAHARRWAPPELLAEGVDARGYDRFVDDAARAVAQGLLEDEFVRALERVGGQPGLAAAGFYPAHATKADSAISPICQYLPAFNDPVSGKPKAVFALRRIEDDAGARYVAVTVLPPPYAARAIRLLGALPSWLAEDEPSDIAA